MEKVKVETSGMVREVELEELSAKGIEQFIQEEYAAIHYKMTLNFNSISSDGKNLYGMLFYTIYGEYGTSSVQVFTISYRKSLNTLRVQDVYLNKHDIEKLNQMNLTA